QTKKSSICPITHAEQMFVIDEQTFKFIRAAHDDYFGKLFILIYTLIIQRSKSSKRMSDQKFGLINLTNLINSLAIHNRVEFVTIAQSLCRSVDSDNMKIFLFQKLNESNPAVGVTLPTVNEQYFFAFVFPFINMDVFSIDKYRLLLSLCQKIW